MSLLCALHILCSAHSVVLIIIIIIIIIIRTYGIELRKCCIFHCVYINFVILIHIIVGALKLEIFLWKTKGSTANREKHEKHYKDTTSVSIGSKQINQSRPSCGKRTYIRYENEGFTRLLLAFLYALNPEFSL